MASRARHRDDDDEIGAVNAARLEDLRLAFEEHRREERDAHGHTNELLSKISTEAAHIPQLRRDVSELQEQINGGKASTGIKGKVSDHQRTLRWFWAFVAAAMLGAAAKFVDWVWDKLKA